MQIHFLIPRKKTKIPAYYHHIITISHSELATKKDLEKLKKMIHQKALGP